VIVIFLLSSFSSYLTGFPLTKEFTYNLLVEVFFITIFLAFSFIPKFLRVYSPSLSSKFCSFPSTISLKDKFFFSGLTFSPSAKACTICAFSKVVNHSSLLAVPRTEL
jgi:hypothetical protein